MRKIDNFQITKDNKHCLLQAIERLCNSNIFQEILAEIIIINMVNNIW